MNKWQPIATAPRDDTAILVCRFGKEKYPSYNVVYFDDRNGQAVTHVWHFVDASGSYHRDWPTHWQPLKPPTETQE